MHAFSTNLTFNPGPSQLSAKTIQDIADIAASGLLSLSHRSSKFLDISQKAIEGLRRQMRLPSDYLIFYQPSATCAMDTLLRNLVLSKSFHFTHGAFSKRFFKTALGIGLHSSSFESPWNEEVFWQQTIPSDAELIAITHNETSTGLIWPKEILSLLRKSYPDPLIAIDATSSFGSMSLPWQEGDIWFGSVQKCLGLPSGLGFLIVGPKAYEKAKIVISQKEGIAPWQRFDHLQEKMKTYETEETPNMLAIALLAMQMEYWDLDLIEKELLIKTELLYQSPLPWKPYIIPSKWRSQTVANFIVKDPAKWHALAKENFMILGQGYGPLKETCVRIANFPAISIENINHLLKIFSESRDRL